MVLALGAGCAETASRDVNPEGRAAEQVPGAGDSRPASDGSSRESDHRESMPVDASHANESCELISLAHVGLEDKALPIVVAHAGRCARWARFEVDQVSAGSDGFPEFVALPESELLQLLVVLDDEVAFHRVDHVPEVRGFPAGAFVVVHSASGERQIGSLSEVQSCGVFEDIEQKFADPLLRAAMRMLRVAVHCGLCGDPLGVAGIPSPGCPQGASRPRTERGGGERPE